MENLKKICRSIVMKQACRLVWDRKSITIALLVAILVNALFAMVYPYAMKLFVDEGVSLVSDGITNVNVQNVMIASLVFMLHPIISLFIVGLSDALEKDLAEDVDTGLQANIRRKFEKVSQLQLFAKYKPSELAVGLPEWTKKISFDVASTVPDLIEHLIKAVFVVVAMWLISPLMGVFCMSGILTLMLAKRSMKRYQNLNEMLFEHQNKLMGHTAEYIRAFSIIQLYRASARENKEFERLSQEYKETRRKTLWTKIVGIDFFTSLSDAIVTGIILLVGLLYLQELTIGEALSFMSYTATFQISVSCFLRRYLSILEMTPNLDRCDELLNLKETSTKPNPFELDEVRSIKFRNVTAYYPGKDIPAIRNVTFFVQRGEKIALVGMIGSGKSTIAYLLVRMLEPSEGEILINDHPIEDYSIDSLRAKFILHIQGSGVLDRSIAKNLRLGNPDATEEQLVEVTSSVAFDISHEARATDLSGGQMQGLGVARALLQNQGEVFVLDEFTSAFDPISEAKMLRNLAERLHGKIQFIIAHRYSTIRDVDRIIVMKNGEIVQMGTKEELLENRDGLFFELWSEQMGSTVYHKVTTPLELFQKWWRRIKK